jgi:putative ABC transport system permease protein
MAALLLSLWLAALALPQFSRLFDLELSFWGAEYSLPLLAVMVLLLAVLASVYPAFVISHFHPTKALRGVQTQTTVRTLGFRQGLVVLQFVISVSLIIGTAVIYYQLHYVQNRDLGFNSEQVVIVNLGARMPASARESFRQRILSQPGVVSASVPNAVPDRFMMGYTRPVDETAPQSQVSVEIVKFRPAVVDYDFIPTLEISMLAGRNFSRDFSTDVSNAYILNKAAVAQLGWSPAEAVGKLFKLGTEETPAGEIIGVADDFHIESLHQAVAPVVLQLHTNSPVGSIPFVLAARLMPGQIRNAVEDIRQEFNQIAPPGAPFQYSFLDDRFEAMYSSEQQLSRIFSSFAVLAIFIACLGLFGLAAYTAETRTKEVGVRKVLGASLAGIVGLLSKDFVKLVLIANLIAWPIAYFAMNIWLQDFAYRIEIGWWLFAAAAGAALLIALLTVSAQAIKAALANPVESLRYE